jgi:hypothetical protein
LSDLGKGRRVCEQHQDRNVERDYRPCHDILLV